MRTRLRLLPPAAAVVALLLLVGGVFPRAQVVLVPGAGVFTSVTTPVVDSTTGTLTLGGTSNITAAGNIAGAAAIRAGAASNLGWSGRAQLLSPADGVFTANNSGATIGSEFKVDALPTVASGFGTGPAITAGSTPLAGSVNVGTGAPGTSGILNFAGTAFPSAPFCQANNTVTLQVVKATASTTQLTLTSAGFTASDIVAWLCVSSR